MICWIVRPRQNHSPVEAVDVDVPRTDDKNDGTATVDVIFGWIALKR